MPADRATLADLARRLEGGETGREMDWDIAATIRGWRADAVPFDHRSDSGVPHLTTSLDAAATLVERLCPKAERWSWHLHSLGYDEGVFQDGKAGATIESPFSSGGGPLWRGFHTEPAAALALALVRALMARGDAG